jgi:Xaa-Pro aminopeptidase
MIPQPVSPPPSAIEAVEAAPAYQALPSLRERARLQDALTRERLDTIVPGLMERTGIDCWVLLAREYAEDPVILTMLDAGNWHARRQTMLVFFRAPDGKVERFTVSRYGLAGLFQPAWNPEAEPDQWVALVKLIAAHDPKRIAVNMSEIDAHADGLSATQHAMLLRALPETLRSRVVSSEPLAVGWLETRTEAEIAEYRRAVRTAHAIIGQAFSRAAIAPGRTTTADVVWWMRGKLGELALATWFQPSVAVFRAGADSPLEGDTVIRPGDLIWCDFGLIWLGLHTDTQHLGYVLKPGETDAPAGLRAGLAAANAAQDALTASFATGRTGNAMLAAARARTAAAGVDATIYSHPIGLHGHAAGSAIGFWDDQRPGPKGEHPLAPKTAWSIELKAAAPVPEWGGQRVDFRLEEDGWWDGTRFRWLDGRMTRFHLIGQ